MVGDDLSFRFCTAPVAAIRRGFDADLLRAHQHCRCMCVRILQKQTSHIAFASQRGHRPAAHRNRREHALVFGYASERWEAPVGIPLLGCEDHLVRVRIRSGISAYKRRRAHARIHLSPHRDSRVLQWKLRGDELVCTLPLPIDHGRPLGGS